MTRKSITTTRAAVACDVCGRTLLRGEHADNFIANGSRRMVCELCTARAANEGWIREGADNTLQVRRNGVRGSGRSLLERLRPRREPQREVPVAPVRRVSGNVDRIPSRNHTEDSHGGEHDETPERVPEAPVALQAQEQPPASREPRHVRAVPTNADLKIARALDVFNASAHPRRIAGVARSLGVPIVSVMPSETAGAIVSIVVGWELCWYRYEVDLADEAAGVRVSGQGAELSELTDAEQVPNAAADERGLLVLAA
jgi:transposase-like protein